MAQPKLRFKREDGTEFPQLNKCCFMDLVDGKISNGLFTETSKIGSGVKLINVSNLYDEPYINYDKLDLLNVDVEILESNRVKPFDLLFTRSSVKAAGVAHCNIYTGNDYDVVFDGHIMKASIKTNLAIPMYVKYIMESPTIRNRTLQKAKTGAFTTIGQEDLGSVILTITPSIEEQQKIADFLSTVDEVIAHSEAEVQNLEQQKKAAMQKIFSQEVRFRREGGTKFPEWEDKSIGSVAVVKVGEKPDLVLEEPSDFEYINAGTTHSGYTTSFNCEGDTVTTPSRGQGGIGYVGYQSKKFWLGSLCYKIKSNDMNAMTKYIFYALAHHSPLIIDLKKVGSIPAINREDLIQIALPFPCLEEQQRIADFLSAYDEAIACAKQELDQWKKLKKGLLQQMFV